MWPGGGEELRRVGDRDIDTPWVGVFSDHRDFGGYRVPTRAEVVWECDERLFTYWRGDVTDFYVEARP